MQEGIAAVAAAVVTDVSSWLAQLGLESHARAFLEGGYGGLEDIMAMGFEEIMEIRNMEKDHAKRIFQEAAKLRQR